MLIYIHTGRHKHGAKEDLLALAIRTTARDLEWQSRQQLREIESPCTGTRRILNKIHSDTIESYRSKPVSGLFVVTRSFHDLSFPGQGPTKSSLSAPGELFGEARGRNLLIAPQTMPLDSAPSVQEQPVFRILYHPCQSFLQMLPRNCTASEDGPLVRQDCIELQLLQVSILLLTVKGRGPVSTSLISSSIMQPLTSVLFAKTSRLAPMSRCSLISKSLSLSGEGTYLLQQQRSKLLSAVTDP